MPSKSIFLSAILFISCCSLADAQYFSFVRTSDSVVVGSPDSIIVHSYATVTNLTSSSFNVQFSAANVVVAAGWDTMGICDWHNCYAGGYFNINSNIAPGPHDMYVYFNHYYYNGISSCRITITYLTQSVSQYFTARYGPIGIRQISSVVKDFSLNQNYPNPFNPSTKISFAIPKRDLVLLRVYDILGREMKTLVNEELAPGEYEYDFDAKNMSSGFYYYSLRSGENVSVKKMVLVK